MAVEVGSLTQIEPVLDAVPTPLLLVEPGTARVLYVNAAAHRLAGGRMEKAADADHAAIYGLFDPSGRRLSSESGTRKAAAKNHGSSSGPRPMCERGRPAHASSQPLVSTSSG